MNVVGHTDNVGTLASNMGLSKRRGDAVVAVLTTTYKVAAARITAAGDGPAAPVASNDTEDKRAKNLRVELVNSKQAERAVLHSTLSTREPHLQRR